MTGKKLQEQELEMIGGGGSLVYEKPENATFLKEPLNTTICDNYELDKIFDRPKYAPISDHQYFAPIEACCAYCKYLIGYDTPESRTYYCRNINNLRKIK